MEEEKKMKEKRKRLENKYLENLEGLYKRVDAATTMEECREIHLEFMRLGEELKNQLGSDLINQDRELFLRLREEDLRFGDALDGKVEMLGGPKAPLRR